VFERAKTVCALDRAATMIGNRAIKQKAYILTRNKKPETANQIMTVKPFRQWQLENYSVTSNIVMRYVIKCALGNLCISFEVCVHYSSVYELNITKICKD
jgi:hypothetical protein